MNFRDLRPLLNATCVLLAATLLFRLTDLDLILQRFFFHPEEGWLFGSDNPWSFLYQYGSIPAFGLLAAAIIVLTGSLGWRRLRPHRKGALFVMLAMAIGPGLLVNTLLKDHWGRPRPAEVEAFGGREQFLRLGEMGPPAKNKSFPSGHAAVGFFLMTPYFVWRRTAPRPAAAFLVGGLAYGALMGLGRMIQGGHFASDVVWAGGIVFLTGYFLSLAIGLGAGTED